MTDQKNMEARADRGAGTPAITGRHGSTISSRQVSWFEVYSFAERLATSHGVGLDHLPLPGTPAWCGMPDDDARKLMALVLGGVRESLNHDVAQEHLAEASKNIATSADWSALAKRIAQGRGAAYVPRREAS